MNKPPSDLKLLKRILSETRAYRLPIAGLFALSVLSSPLGLLAPYPLKIAIDSAVDNKPLPPFLQVILPETVTGSKTSILGMSMVLMVLVALLTQLQTLCVSWLRVYTSERMVLDFRAKLFGHV